MKTYKFNEIEYELVKEYKDGFKHDLSTPDHLGLLYIKNQYPEDYEKIISTFPNLEAGVKKLEFFRGQ